MAVNVIDWPNVAGLTLEATLVVVAAWSTVCVTCCGSAGGEVGVAAIDGRDRVAADRQAAGGEGGLIDSVHDAERAGAQGRGAVLEGHGAGGRAGAGLTAATVAVNVIDWPNVAGVETRRDAGGGGRLRRSIASALRKCWP